MLYRYPVVLLPAEEGGYTVIAPDLKGCVTQGENVEEALEMAKEAIRLWLETALEEKEKLPEPSSLETVAKNLNKILSGVAEKNELEKVILANIEVEIPKTAAA